METVLMTLNPIFLVVLSSVLAAAGQVFLKLGASGTSKFIEFCNTQVATGLLMYAMSTLLWILALSKLPLSKVYPFTVLTFVIVYVASFWILGESLTGTVIVGAILVLAGLVVITTA